METSQQRVINANEVFSKAREDALISSAIQGDKAAYRALYDAHIGRVYALCLRLAGDRGLAEDATQEVFIQLWSKLKNYKGQSQFSTWLHSVTANVTISYIRKQRGWFQRMMNIETSSAMNAEAEAPTSDVDLESLVLRLPERARMVFVLHAIEGYRHEEVAEMLDMAVGSSKAQFHRAKQLLKTWMGYDDE
ncbi:RNA polymerase sigma factor [Alteromonas sp. KUL49]|uniref:RNA polymerase sigma factor n=1 Tax=Alteromonas sp. KUL49 TaxID=2480798 RepID=UPI00102EF4F3|nr:RNA polymerase sigma factor [Alteromonas sp. KUL49]TAP42410.1 RNA polymerase sigma factor [Alteromonas sp. KUL49]GEA10031.1 RNA polymerase subunit sigma-24 [Alteromonas sp. KUL49]